MGNPQFFYNLSRLGMKIMQCMDRLHAAAEALIADSATSTRGYDKHKPGVGETLCTVASLPPSQAVTAGCCCLCCILLLLSLLPLPVSFHHSRRQLIVQHIAIAVAGGRGCECVG